MHKLSYLIIMLLLPVMAWAETVIEMEAPPRQIETGELFYVRYAVVTDDKGEIKLEAKVPGGCNEVTRTVKTSILRRGSISSGRAVTYDIYYRANKSGKFDIPAATVKVGTKSAKSNSGKITIAAPAANVTAEPFLELCLSSKNAKVGEPVTATIILYTPSSVATIHATTDLKADRCKVQKIKLDLGASNPRTIKGKTYQVYKIARFIITPKAAGKITIESGIYRVLLTGKKYALALGAENAVLNVTKGKSSGDNVNDETIFI